MSDRQARLTLLMLWALIFLGHSWEAGLKMDAMTYAALAKNILRTGDWQVLHYTSSAYSDFYQHPPLAIWLQAVVFRLFGLSDGVARLLPAFFALGTLTLTYRWARRSGGVWLGFAAGIVLLTTGRFVKYASDFFLDGPLAFFILLAGYLFLISEDRSARSRMLLASGAGAAMAAAFLTKGLVGCAAPLVLIAVTLLRPGRARNLAFVGTAIGTAVALVMIWVLGFGGAHYLERYWQESVSGRIGGADLTSRLAPFWELAKTYWPWIPLFILGLARVRPTQTPQWLAAAFCAVILLAFAWSGHYLEHYLVPFYPFAAILAAQPLTALPQGFQLRAQIWIRAGVLVLAFALATLPIRLHRPRDVALRDFLSRVQTLCPDAEELVIHPSSGVGRWAALAHLAWYTDLRADFAESLIQAERPTRALLIGRSLEPENRWVRAIDEPLTGFVALQNRSHALCISAR